MEYKKKRKLNYKNYYFPHNDSSVSFCCSLKKKKSKQYEFAGKISGKENDSIRETNIAKEEIDKMDADENIICQLLRTWR